MRKPFGRAGSPFRALQAQIFNKISPPSLLLHLVCKRNRQSRFPSHPLHHSMPHMTSAGLLLLSITIYSLQNHRPLHDIRNLRGVEMRRGMSGTQDREATERPPVAGVQSRLQELPRVIPLNGTMRRHLRMLRSRQEVMGEEVRVSVALRPKPQSPPQRG